jgi:uncharacterized RDD family membrane protein YckC
MQRMDPTRDNDYNLWAIVLLLLLPFLVYHVVCEITMNGQSIGKKLMGIRVVNENGGRPSISQLIIRWLIRTSDYMLLMIILYAPYAMMFGAKFFYAVGASLILLATDVILVNAGKKGQRLGDLLAHTLLISTKQQGEIEDTVFLQVEDLYKPQFPQVMQLSDRDINSLKGILDTARKRHDYELAEKASSKIQSHLNIQTSLSAFDFLEVLLKDYNYLVTK